MSARLLGLIQAFMAAGCVGATIYYGMNGNDFAASLYGASAVVNALCCISNIKD